MATINCEKCGGEMRRKTRSSGNAVGLLLALLVVAAGVVLVAAGLWYIGAPIAIAGLFMGGKREKIWLCRACGYYYPRA